MTPRLPTNDLARLLIRLQRRGWSPRDIARLTILVPIEDLKRSVAIAVKWQERTNGLLT
jgi:hypothetical protein